MHARPAALLLVATVTGALLLSGCSGSPADPAAVGSSQGAVARRLGGPVPVRHAAPTRPMDRLERPVAARLAREVAHLGLRLDYLDCPHWNGRLPGTMTCRAYLDGLVGQVRVRLAATVAGRAVEFDARMTSGVIATRTLEETLWDQGWTRAACGSVPAYPARPGTRIICRVTRDAATRYVVATVTSRAGAVAIADYPR